MSDYVYDPSKMEALFAELTDEDGDYGYSLRWATKYVHNPETESWSDIEDPKHETFEYDGVSFWWYHPENKKHPETPQLVASWSVQKREDDFDEHEEVIDADADSVHNILFGINSGYIYEND